MMLNIQECRSKANVFNMYAKYKLDLSMVTEMTFNKLLHWQALKPNDLDKICMEHGGLLWPKEDL